MHSVDLARLGLVAYHPRRLQAKRVARWAGLVSASAGVFAGGALLGRYWVLRRA